MFLKPIGIIHTPFKDTAPKQTIYSNAEGIVEIFEKYKEGLNGLEKYSHIILIYYFHLSKDYELVVNGKGVFATRSPRRPNPIGLSVVRLKKIDGRKLIVENIDVIDKTPLIDIKPFIPEIDCPKINP